MKNQILAIILFSLVSCNENKSTELLKLEILNKEIYCSNKGFKNNLKSVENIKNYITFKLINNTSKKYFFVLNENNIEYFTSKTLNDSSSIKKGIISFLIESDDNSNIEKNIVIGHNNTILNKECIQFIPEIYEMNRIKSELKDLDYPDVNDYEFSNSIRLNSFAIHPNESKYFRFVLSLPAYSNNSMVDHYLSYFKFDNKKNYRFKLNYQTDSKIIKSKLPKYKIEEIEENKTEIFDGIIVSNTVPIKFVK